MAFAHSKPGAPKDQWQSLPDHLRAVGSLASEFASRFGASELAHLAGAWHDLGKFAPDWQRFLETAGIDAPTLGDDGSAGTRRRGPDHSTAGAIHAGEVLGVKKWGTRLLELVVAAHHAGLPNQEDLRDRLSSPEKRARYEMVRAHAAEIPQLAVLPPSLPPFLASIPPTREPAEREAAMRTFEFLVRMVFSALADADFLDTERFMGLGASTGDSRRDQRPQFRTLARYREALDTHLASFASAERTPVNRERSRVLSWCREAAERPVGAYSLTVPTGGGKTLSALAFALRHAEVHGLERVVVALPFLSILDQTADVFRRALEPQLGTPVLVEHHSSVMPTADTVANRLAAENWDAPLIVTTQVQLFESLFSRRPSQCRKLHRLAKSVVVLDEIQTLPVELLAPILGQLQELRAHYDTTLVLTTATQPSLHTRELGPKLFNGLRPAPVEIVPEHAIEGLFETLRRVDIELPEDDAPIGLEDLSDRIQRHAQVLVVVHRRADAIQLFRACESRNKGGWIHLSALMCPAHRREVLAEIRSRLADGLPCRVVSTQLVEAGVDVDFPVVYRAMAGLESLAQSAGRCNREGKLEGRGRFIVFRADSEPPGSLRHHRDIAAAILKADPGIDPLAPATFRRYFDTLYAQRNLDSRGIQALRAELRFESVDREFQMIESGGETVFVPYGDKGRRAVEAVRFAGPSRERFRALQAYGVTVYPFDLAKLRAVGAIEELEKSRVNVLLSDIHYDRSVGLVVDPEPFGAAII